VEPGTELTFAPPAGGAQLARRALEHLRTQPLRQRFRREPVSRSERHRTRS
jgi:hypothetical protein